MNFSTIRHNEANDTFDQHGFAGTGFTQYHQIFSPMKRQIKMIQYLVGAE
jgi:hypothetical protein